MTQLFKSKGKIKFDPKAIRDPSSKMFKPNWVIVTLEENDIVEYYSWFLEKEYGIRLQRPAFGPHISLIRGEPINEDLWKIGKGKWDGHEVEFQYISPPRTNGKHWWLRIFDETELERIRTDIGYDKKGMWVLHLTVGTPVPRHLERSYKVWNLFKKGLLNFSS